MLRLPKFWMQFAEAGPPMTSRPAKPVTDDRRYTRQASSLNCAARVGRDLNFKISGAGAHCAESCVDRRCQLCRTGNCACWCWKCVGCARGVSSGRVSCDLCMWGWGIVSGLFGGIGSWVPGLYGGLCGRRKWGGGEIHGFVPEGHCGCDISHSMGLAVDSESSTYLRYEKLMLCTLMC